LRESSAHWLEQLQAAGVPCALVNDLGAAARDPHAVARKIIEWREHPDFGTIPSIRFPPIMSATPATYRTRPPRLGEHTDALLSEFGYSAEKIRELHDSHTV
jgi:formyl-CoA transferase/CoA:oxalate CoA-transferase